MPGSHQCRYPLKLLGFWLMHSLWEWVVLLPVTAAQSFSYKQPLTRLEWAAAAVFAGALAFENVADRQKAVARSRVGNKRG